MLANLLLFAQQDMPDFSAEVPDAAILGGLLFVVFIAALIGFAIGIAILYLVFSCYQLFNLVWVFFVFPKLGKSYQSYFAEQGRTDLGDCGEKIGLWYAICAVLGCIPCVNYIAGPAALVLLIVFLVKALTLKGLIPEGTA